MKIITILLLVLNMLFRLLFGSLMPNEIWGSLMTGDSPSATQEDSGWDEPIEFGDGEEFTIIIPEGQGSAGF